MEQSLRTASSVLEPIGRGRDAIGNAASDAMNTAGSELQSLRDELNKLSETVGKFVSQAGNDAMKSAREVSANVAGQVGSMATNIADRGAEMAHTASSQAKGFAVEFENMARRNPIGAMAGAMMLGVLIGMMGRRD